MKHKIGDPDSYFDELDNYEFMIEVVVPHTEWMMTSPMHNKANNRRVFRDANPTCRITLGENFKGFQNLIDNKDIIVAGEQMQSDKLYPINYISSNDSPLTSDSLKIRIFYNTDTVPFITKFKLTL